MLQEHLAGKYGGLIRALIVSHTVSLLLFIIRVAGAYNFRYWFLFWNLLLAWIPLLLAVWLKRSLQRRRWMSWQNVSLTFLWLGFLPNSFYILSDMIHIHPTGEINILFDVVMFASFIFNAYMFGFISVYLVHQQLLRRTSVARAHLATGAALLACSFAIYLGRYLRWNTWDILIHPFGVLFDISHRLINPAAHPQTITTTFIFFVLLSSIYYVIWELVKLLRSPNR